MKFKPFNETFKFCSFGMALASIYPNTTKGHARKRALTFIAIITFSGFQIFWFIVYTVNCLLKLDIFNFARNITLGAVVMLYFFKSIYAIKYTDEYASIIDTITRDNLKGNEMDEGYQKIYRHYLKKSKTGELVWAIIPLVLSVQYPLYAAVYTIYETMQSDTGKRYMVHEMDMIYVEDIQYETPFFEFFFAYNMTQCLFLVPIFVGFDGSFCITTTHLCLKLKLMIHKLNRAFKEASSIVDLRGKMKEVVQDHQEALQFYSDLQEFYGSWLLTLFLVASITISFNLYLLHILKRFDLKYVTFLISAILNIYVPCSYASALTAVSEEIVWDLYCAPWERVHDPFVTKTLIFMIARAQQPLMLSGKGVLYFNMPLFISMMQSAYSFYTLITS